MTVRYQVFVSSTFRDLVDERREVIQALLELDCIPAGMEMFPATNSDQWSLITRVIDDSDYYVVIVGGRYGSLDVDGVSYTEREYDYALKNEKPIIGFVHKEPGEIPQKNSEKSEEGQLKLAAFREKVLRKMCKEWSSPADLGGAVSRSLVNLMKSDPAVGWVRGSEALTTERMEEIDGLRKLLSEYESERSASQFDAPKGAERLASGDEECSISADVTDHYNTFEVTVRYSWNELFKMLGPLMMDESSEKSLATYLGTNVLQMVEESYLRNMEMSRDQCVAVVLRDDFQQVKIQFFALGLIQKNLRKRGINDKDTYWTLTPYGEGVLMKLRAVVSSHRSDG